MGIQKIIKEKRLRLEAIEAEANKLRAELDVLQKARAVMRGEDIPEEPSPPRRGRPRGKMAGKLNPSSAIGQAVELLREAGEPKHVDWLVSKLRDAGIHAKKQSLVSSLAKFASTGYIVRRSPGPSTFGLIEWGDQQQAEAGDVTTH